MTGDLRHRTFIDGFPVDVGRRNLEAGSSRERCYTLSYERPIIGLATLYVPTFLTMSDGSISRAV